MAKYHVYGVGNALVDKEFEVKDEFFVDHGIEKGVMTLVDEDQQIKLLTELEKRFGVKKQAGGGSAGNTLYAVSQFGGEAFYACKVANDDTGDYFLDQMGHHNIDTSVSRRTNGISGRCIVMISPDAERTMHTFLGVSAELSEAEMDFEAARNSEYIYIEGYLVTSPPAKAAIIKLKQELKGSGTKVAMTFSDPAMLEYFKDDINDVLGEGVDMLFCNEREALLWSGKESREDACEALKSIARQFVITLGADGALGWDGERYVRIAGHKVKAINTNGAGDLFAGAFMYAITQGRDFEFAGKLASLASARVVTQYGPRLDGPAHEEILNELMQESEATAKEA